MMRPDSLDDARTRARIELARRRAIERDKSDLGAFIPRISPEFENPKHLAPLCKIFDRIMAGESIFALVEAPPRHAKSETVFHGIARLIKYHGKRCTYSTYSNQFAYRKSKRIRELVGRAGGFATEQRKSASGFAASQAVSFWETPEGGSLIAGGRGGGYKGEGFDFIAVDDPYKNRAEYESPVVREAVRELWMGTLRDRVEPGGSVIIFHQRWGKDDLIATIKENDIKGRWETVSLPVVEDYEEDKSGSIIAGEPLWPERYDVAALQALKDDVGDYNWWSQFMQQPRIRGDVVFEDPTFYNELPSEGFRVAFGIDLAYSEHTKNDFTVIIRGIATGKKLYVTDFARVQKTIVGVSSLIKNMADASKGAPWRWYVGGMEKAIAASLRRDTGAYIKAVPAKNDKFIRATPAAKAWNQGRILLPAGAPWLSTFIGEVTSFTGTKADAHDDIVDALAALHDELLRSSGIIDALT